MGWRRELFQVLLLCAVASREHMVRLWVVFFLFNMLLQVFLQTLYFERFRKNVCDITFPVTGQSGSSCAFFYSICVILHVYSIVYV